MGAFGNICGLTFVKSKTDGVGGDWVEFGVSLSLLLGGFDGAAATGAGA